MKYAIPSILAALLGVGLIFGGRGAEPGGDGGVTSLRWGTSAVGSAGHRAKVSLSAVLNRSMPDYDINVMPTSSALATIRGHLLGQFEGYYGADIAFHELAEGSGRFSGFSGPFEREPVQSFWAYTMEVGLAVRRSDQESHDGWEGLAGRALFTGPAAWDVRAQLDRALHVLGVDYRYRELDLGLAGSALAEGSVDGIIVYTAGEGAPAAWVAEADLATDLALLNPSAQEIARLTNAGIEVVEIDRGLFREPPQEGPLYFLPFYYGFHVGLEIPAEDVYRMLVTIEENVERLARTDAVFRQIEADMPGLQRRGVAASISSVRVHPGLARYMRERGVWDSAWDGRVAE